MPRISQPLVEPGVILRYFADDEVADLVSAWLDAFGMDRHGINSKAYLWHIFSGGRYPSVEREEAVAEYRKHISAEYFVLSNDRKTAFSTDVLPSKVSLLDCYVFPPNLAWTMAFTHEEGWLGPYFAKHANFEALNKANLAQVRKRREAEAARSKGWQ